MIVLIFCSNLCYCCYTVVKTERGYIAMRYKLHAFFSGRNGLDALGKGILWPALILLVASNLISIGWLRSSIYYLALVLIVYVYIRIFSRNIERCQMQNRRFLAWKNYHKLRFQQRKTHRFYSCPNCKQHLRVPKGKGKINIVCKSCGNSFVKKT